MSIGQLVLPVLPGTSQCCLHFTLDIRHIETTCYHYEMLDIDDIVEQETDAPQESFCVAW
jgi:hypothetical protein